MTQPPSTRTNGPARAPARQRGVVLFIALIVLVAMSLAGVALVRSVDTNVLIAGNLAFQQGATLSADAAINVARRWVVDNSTGTLLDNDSTSSGYFSSWQAGFDPRTFDWAANSVSLGNDAAGYDRRYVVHRLCDSAGVSTSRDCVKAGSSGKLASSFGGQNYGTYPLQLAGQSPTYRITARVVGPKSTTSYVQVVIAP